MNLDISHLDRKKLYDFRQQLTYMQGQVNYMADQYTDTSPESEACGDIGPRISGVMMTIDDILMPE
jgi:hypothetical protein